MQAISQDRPLDREIKSFAAKYNERAGNIVVRLRYLDSIFGGDAPLLQKAMSAAHRDNRPPSFDSAATVLDSIKRVAVPVITTPEKEEKDAIFSFINALTLFNDGNQRISVASHIAAVMDTVDRAEELKDGTALTILSAVNTALAHPLSSSMPQNFEDAVAMAAAFEGVARALKKPERIVEIAGILSTDWLADLRRREIEGD